ncbi:ubiquitin-like-conjugating enzyme ATG10 [Caerostris darwini]|uniref:Ubiquitin-like-conjugating enzyme ATG10 n=1 Tax=Caerostris darwini TaxID=1538125 RepID=A0AAV4MFK3_9ARAC|nr:ubiquitin-like-conjugating enzyme ATG10 [Caerostris darwini]
MTSLSFKPKEWLKKQMTLEFEKFKIYAEEFASISSQLGDEWVIKRSKIGENVNIYLEKRIVKSYNEESENKNTSNISSDEIEFLSPSYIIFVYHIIYSQSYSVPVLWFTAHYEDGKLLSLEELWKSIPNCFKTNEPNTKWNMLTQQEHPILGIPYFTVHPCYTADLLSACCSSNYVISWLKTINTHFPSDMWFHINTDGSLLDFSQGTATGIMTLFPFLYMLDLFTVHFDEELEVIHLALAICHSSNLS